MKRLHGLEAIVGKFQGFKSSKALAEILLQDLRQCHCEIYGSLKEQQVLLAELTLQADSLAYEMFDQRIDLTVAGKIKRNDCVPLTYRLLGEQFSITGRCSMIPKVCGVDLYLNSSYSGQIGANVHQKFKIDVKKVLKKLK